MIYNYLLPVIVILAVGSFLVEKMRRQPFYTMNFYQWFCESLLIGTFLLIYPMVLVGVLLENKLYIVVFGYHAIGLLIVIYYIIHTTLNIKPSLLFNHRTISILTKYRIYSLILAMIVVEYIFLNFLYPPRGWDALQFYFPNSLYYYLEDDIPAKGNPFTFFPSFKPPSNVLLLTYSQYITEGFYAQLIPILFIIGISYLTIIFSSELGLSGKQGRTAAILLLVTPAFYSVILEYIYYQELPVTFYYSFGIIYYYKASKSNEFIEYLFSAMGFSLAVLSKLSGFSYPFVLIVSFSLFQSRISKFIRIGILQGVGIFLFFKTSSDQYIGFGLVILVISLFLSYQIYTEKNDTINAKKRVLGLVTSITLYIVTMAIWITHMLKFPKVVDGIQDLYFNRTSNSISWNFSNNKIVEEFYLENAQSASFWVSSLTIFVAAQFTLFLLVPKVLGIYQNIKKFPVLNLWLGSFYILWIAFHATVSIRYLSIIWIPLAITVVIGIDFLIRRFNLSSFEDMIYLITIALSLLFYYPFIPFEFISQEFHLRIFNYHRSILRLFFYTTLFSLLVYLVLKNLNRINSETKIFLGFYKLIVFVLVFILIISPISFQMGVLISNRFDIQEFRDDWAYDNRGTVRELTEFMQSLDFDTDRITVVINIPGLAYYLQRPVLDLLFVSAYLKEDEQQFLVQENITQLIIDFLANDINYIVKLKPAHNYYNAYVNEYVNRYPFLQKISQSNSDKLFSNSEFELWQI